MDTTKFSVDVISQYRNDDDPEFAIMNLKFLSDGYNTHGLIFPTEVLKRDVETIKGKWVVAKYDKFIKDARGHETDEVIVGIIPNDAKITFEETDNGLFACVDAIISKLYAHDIVQMFKDINHRAVSIEALMEHEENDTNKPVSRFVITAVTILGIDVKESCKGACAEIVKFAEDKAQEYYTNTSSDIKSFVTKRKHKFSEDKELDVVQNATLKKEVDSEKMADIKEKEDDIIMDNVDLEESKEEKISDEKLEEAEEMQEEQALADESTDEENAESDNDEQEKEEEMSEELLEEAEEDKQEDEEEMCNKFEELQAQLSEKEEIINAQSIELAELREFKAKVEDTEKMSIVTSTLAKVKDVMDSDVYAKFEEKAMECKFEDITAWKNEVLASVTENVLQMSAQQSDDVIRMEIPQESQKKKGLWD